MCDCAKGVDLDNLQDTLSAGQTRMFGVLCREKFDCAAHFIQQTFGYCMNGGNCVYTGKDRRGREPAAFCDCSKTEFDGLICSIPKQGN